MIPTASRDDPVATDWAEGLSAIAPFSIDSNVAAYAATRQRARHFRFNFVHLYAVEKRRRD
jgi:hypothetical protein